MMMKKMIIIAALLHLTGWAQADELYMSDDSLSLDQPTRVSQQNSADYVYKIPFKRASAQLGTLGKSAVDEMLPRLKRAQKIVVQGRPDHPSTEKTSEKSPNIAAQRAQALKKILVSCGIAESRIFIEQLGETSYSDMTNVYNATIKVYDYAQNDEQIRSDTNAVVSLNSASKLSGVGKQQGIPVSSIRKVLKTAVDNNLSAMDTGRLFESWVVVESPALVQKKLLDANEPVVSINSIRRVLKIAIDGNLNASDASRMFESWLAVEYAPASAAQAPAGMLRNGSYKQDMRDSTRSIPTVTAMPRQVWNLEPSKTLHENIDSWAKQAGWNQPLWKASNNYQVTGAVGFEGDFSDALRQVSDQAKVNICITHAQRSIKITDSNVSCKE